jgi:hypothetical protein
MRIKKKKIEMTPLSAIVQKSIGNALSSTAIFPLSISIVLKMCQRMDLETFERACLLLVVVFHHYTTVATILRKH